MKLQQSGKGLVVMELYRMNDDNGCILPCGFSSCMESDGLFEGVGRDEKRAMRAADLAERAFRLRKGHPATPLEKLLRRLGGAVS